MIRRSVENGARRNDFHPCGPGNERGFLRRCWVRHWVFDIVVGSLYAVVIWSLIRRVFNARFSLVLPGITAHGAVK